jgi:hypothetical protein
MPHKISRHAYAHMFGPTVGDKVRLADTEMFIEVEADRTIYGEEVKFGGGKVIRYGMGQSQVTREHGAVDTVITNALILDLWGIVKADLGIRDGRITGIGRPEIPTPSRASTSSSARRPRRSPARARSSRLEASTATSTSSARNRSMRRSTAGSPPCSVAAPGRRPAPTPPPALRAPGTSAACSRHRRPGR